MSEWWTYRLSDLLMFSNRSYWRLVARYNQDVWPAHLFALLAGLVVMGCIVRPGARTRRIAFVLLGAGWAWGGWAFHLQRYADINTAGPAFAAAFGVQALLLWGAALDTAAPTAAPLQRRAGLGIAGLAVLAYPLLGLVTAPGWARAEVAGLAPDPTAVATLGALLALRGRWHGWPIPVAWCAASGATLMELRVGHAWLLPVAAVLTVALRLSLRAGQRPGRQVEPE